MKVKLKSPIIAKLLVSIVIGIIGGISVLLSFYIIILCSNFIPHNRSNEFVIGMLIFFSWVFIIIPIILACIGALSLKIGSSFQLSDRDYIIMPEVSGIIATMLGIALFGVYSSHTNDWVTFVISHISDFIDFLLDPVSVILVLIYSQCSLIGILLYKLISTSKPPKLE